MKILILSCILTIPFIGFGQFSKDYLLKAIQFSGGGSEITYSVGKAVPISSEYKAQPDTLTVCLLVTSQFMGVAYKKPGHVVLRPGCDPIYYYCPCQYRRNKKKPRKCEYTLVAKPYEIWGYKITN